ncbi:MAG TPA: DUF4399 domain-containing protein [Bacteroidia bacterium]|jgi:hypothetical protein|nr:DUF4399 domain-containing protein [Bacteroidia bacterium]
MKIKFLAAALLATVIIACNQSGKETNSDKGQTTSDTIKQANGVYFVNLKDGDKVKSPVIIQMGVTGMTVEPAGAVNEGKGHYHLIIDGSYTEKGQMVPKDSTHIHFGKGQTVDTLKLSPGQHTLTLQFADGMHMSLGKEWSKTITITVE